MRNLHLRQKKKKNVPSWWCIVCEERRAFNTMSSIESGPRPGCSDKDYLGGHWLPLRPPGNWNKLVLSAWEPASCAPLTSVFFGMLVTQGQSKLTMPPWKLLSLWKSLLPAWKKWVNSNETLCPSVWLSDYWNDELQEARIFSRNLLLGEGKGWSLAPDSGKKSLPRKEIFSQVL